MALKRTWLFGLAVATLVGLSGCHNPADDVPAATTTAAVTNAPAAGSAAPAASTPAVPSATASAKKYTLSPDSKIGFIGSKVTGSHHGGFKSFKGQLAVVDGKLAPAQVIEIDTTSMWADDDRLAGHLKSKDFFSVAEFPTSTFTSTSIEKGAAGYTVTGNLNLHGVTKSITFPAAVEITDNEVKIKADFSIKRFDFGIQYKGKADDLIRDEVVINLDIVAKAG